MDFSGSKRPKAAHRLSEGGSGGEDVVHQEHAKPLEGPWPPSPPDPKTSSAPVTGHPSAARGCAEVCEHLEMRHLQSAGHLPPQLGGMVDPPVPHPPRGPWDWDDEGCCDVDWSTAAGDLLRKLAPQILRGLGTPPVLEVENSPTEFP